MPKSNDTAGITIKLLKGRRVIRTYHFQKDEVVLGSGGECDVTLAGSKDILDEHLHIYLEDGEITIVPTEGASLTLNDQQVDVAVPSPDDIFKAGALRFSVEQSSSATGKAESKSESVATPPAASNTGPHAKTRPTANPYMTSMDASADTIVETPPEIAKEILKERKKKKKKKKHVIDDTILAPDQDDRRSRPKDKGWLDRKLKPEPKSTPEPAPGSVGALREAPKTAPETESAPVIAPKNGWNPPNDEYYFSEDEGDEFSFVEPFSLTEALEKKPQVAQHFKREKFCAIQVSRFINGKVEEIVSVLPGQSYSSPLGTLRLIASPQRAKLIAHEDVSGILTQSQSETPLQAGRLRRRHYRPILREGDSATLKAKDGHFKIEVYKPRLAPRPAPLEGKGLKRYLQLIDPMMARMVGLAFGFHLFVIILLTVAMPALDFTADIPKEEEFLEIVLEEPKTEEEKKKKVKRKPRPRPRPQPSALQMAEHTPKVNSKVWKKIKARPKASGAGGTKDVGALLKVLSAGSGSKGASGKITDLVSNIDAAPGVGSKSSFNIAGAIASLPGGKVNVARSGGGGVVSTLSGDLAAGKRSGIGAIGSAKLKGSVRGTVTKLSSGAKVNGKLSKSAVMQVINAHFHEVQGCYESALSSGKGGGSGRIIFEWVVTTTGKTRGVRVRSSSLGNPKVANCIRSKIAKWRFPRPQGGEVTIGFPFLFRSVSS